MCFKKKKKEKKKHGDQKKVIRQIKNNSKMACVNPGI